jgi:hypothetical protein
MAPHPSTRHPRGTNATDSDFYGAHRAASVTRSAGAAPRVAPKRSLGQRFGSLPRIFARSKSATSTLLCSSTQSRVEGDTSSVESRLAIRCSPGQRLGGTLVHNATKLYNATRVWSHLTQAASHVLRIFTVPNVLTICHGAGPPRVPTGLAGVEDAEPPGCGDAQDVRSEVAGGPHFDRSR